MADSESINEKKISKYAEDFLYDVIQFMGLYLTSNFDYLFRGSKFDRLVFQSRQGKDGSVQTHFYTNPLTYLFLSAILLIYSTKMVLEANGSLHVLWAPLAIFVEEVSKSIISMKPTELLYLIVPVILIVALYAKLTSWVIHVFKMTTTFEIQLKISSYFIGNLFMLYSINNILLFFTTDEPGHKWNLLSNTLGLPITILVNLFMFIGIFRYFSTLKTSISSTWLSALSVYCASVGIYFGIPYALYLLNNIGWSLE